jgi:hypothetical protein
MPYGLIKVIKRLYIHVRTSNISPIEKKYAGYTIFPGIRHTVSHPPRKLIPNLTARSTGARLPGSLKLDPTEIRVIKTHFKISRPQKRRKGHPGGEAASPAACAIFFLREAR